MNAFEILVTILSITLIVLLLICIAVAISVHKLILKLRAISEKAEDVVEDVEAVSGFFRKTAGPVAITGLISNIVSKVAEISERKGTKNGK